MEVICPRSHSHLVTGERSMLQEKLMVNALELQKRSDSFLLKLNSGKA